MNKEKGKKKKEKKKKGSPSPKMADLLYSQAWIEPENHAIDVIVSGTNKKRIKRIEYTVARGVIQKAWEITDLHRLEKIDLSEEVEVMGKFRDELGRRMPPITCACALIADIYGASSAMYGNTTVQKKRIDKKAVYVEHTHGNETEYKHTLTKLDRLFSNVFNGDECKKSEFRDISVNRGDLADGWLETNHMVKFWETIKARVRVRVDFYETLMNATVDKGKLSLLAKGIRKGMNRHYAAGKKNYVALFPINIRGKHHTIARAEYDNTESTLVVTYYDSLEYAEKKKKCGLVHQVFVEALEGAKKNGYTWARGNNIKYTMEDGIMQKQEDEINCGVFVCMLMLEAAGGDKPAIHERTIDEGDIRKVRCIIARNHKKEAPSEPADGADDGGEVLLVSQAGIRGIPEERPNRAQKIKRPNEKRSHVIQLPETIVLD